MTREPRARRSTLAAAFVAAIGVLLALLAPLSSSAEAASPMSSCGPLTPGHVTCFSTWTIAPSASSGTQFTGFTPAGLAAMYALPANYKTLGAKTAIAVVTVGGYKNVATDLAHYRNVMKLPKLKTHQLTQINDAGKVVTTPVVAIKPVGMRQTDWDKEQTGWAEETALDVQMVSAICPACNIVVAEASSSNVGDLVNAIRAASAFKPPKSWTTKKFKPTWSSVKYLSLSLGGVESKYEATASWALPRGVTIVAASGDDGAASGDNANSVLDLTTGETVYQGAMWPASMDNVVAAGGVSAVKDPDTGAYTFSAWDGSGSGCSEYVERPSYQTLPDSVDQVMVTVPTGTRFNPVSKTIPWCTVTDPTTGADVPARATTDVSAVADANTGVKEWFTGALTGCTKGCWLLAGGTSAAAPQIAAMYAMAGNASNPGVVYANAANTALVNPDGTPVFADVTDGTTQQCNLGGPICTAAVGWDGPTGLGVPRGLYGFMLKPPVVAPPGATSTPSTTPRVQ